MRQRGLVCRKQAMLRAIWALAGIALALLLTFSSWPIGQSAILAAPPEPGSNVEDDAVASDEPAPREDLSSQLDLLPDEAHTTSGKDEPSDAKRAPQDWPGLASIRRRGLEAPVQLRKLDPTPVAEEVDKGDGEPRQNRSSDAKQNQDTESPDAKKRTAPQRDIRVWPMSADSYSFTQAFGCTQQIAQFYLPGPGCPASAPVVHSGVDLAAPEGTPFYAAASGWVTSSGYDREVGVPNTRIIIQHDGRNDGYATEYLHWIASFVEPGDYVEAGEQIGEVGSVGYSTGPHLHFSVVDLDTGEHIDPVRWLPDEPGSQGYRGIRPNTRAQMRLPAGTTAGVPESSDPAPPPPPAREEVPESPPAGDNGNGNGKDRTGEKRKAKREERRAEKRAASPNESASTDESANSTETTADDSVRAGKDKERTKKRERNKDGQQTEDTSSGEDGSQHKSKDKSDRKGKNKGNDNSNNDPNKGRRGNGNGNGNGHKNGSDRQNNKRNDDKVKQRKTDDPNANDPGASDDNTTDGGNGGDDAPDNDGSTGDGTPSGDDNQGDNGSSGEDNATISQDQPAGETTAEPRARNDRAAVTEPAPDTTAPQPSTDETAADQTEKPKRRQKS